jgi:hypothetical protein
MKAHLHHSSKIKNYKEVKKTVDIKVFLTFLLDDRKSGFGSLPLTDGSKSRRAKNLRIWNTGSDIGIGSQTLITQV